jgi:hypothetical protein
MQMNEATRLPFVVTTLSILLLSAVTVPARAAEAASHGKAAGEEVTLRSEDVVAQWPWLSTATAAAGAACHSTTPCGSAYPSCASWSGYSDCGDPFCAIAKGCGQPCGDPACLGPATRQPRERFRVCFDALGNSCTEYQNILGVVGCYC